MINFVDLRLSHKFSVIGVLAATVLAIPSFMVLRVDLLKLDAANVALSGLAPSEAVIKLVQLTQQHRGLSAMMLAGNDEAAPVRQAKQREVETVLAAAREALGGLADDGLRSATQTIVTEWQSLTSELSGKTLRGAESFARHTALIDRQLDLLQDVTVAAGIVRLPNAESYFLQDGVLMHLPKVTETLGQLRATGAAVLARGEASAADRARIGTLGAQVRAYSTATRKSLTLATRSDPGLLRRLAEPTKQALVSAEMVVALTDERISRAEDLNMPPKEYFDACTQAIDQQFTLVDVALGSLRQQLQDAAAAARNQMLILAGALAALVALALWIIWTVIRSTTGSINAALRVAESVAAGDLSVVLPRAGKDEIGKLLAALGRMQASLTQVVGQVRENADGVASASAQIAQGNQNLSQRTEQQASSLEEAAASMEELSATVKQNADNARQANQLALSASTVAVKGGDVVGQVVQTMKGINESSKKIADIISVIDGIAFQTNILALNAAVEAARAGEQGRGFAVVASEVRSLARRSADAAKEIKSLITASVERVDAGTALVDEAGATMTEVVGSIKRVTDIMGEISAASAEQSAGVAHVGEAVGQMDQATQQNAALVEQSAAAAQSLRTQAQLLVQAVAVFKFGRGSQTQAASPVVDDSPVEQGRVATERRGPDRAKNVTRPNFGAKVPTYTGLTSSAQEVNAWPIVGSERR